MQLPFLTAVCGVCVFVTLATHRRDNESWFGCGFPTITKSPLWSALENARATVFSQNYCPFTASYIHKVTESWVEVLENTQVNFDLSHRSEQFDWLWTKLKSKVKYLWELRVSYPCVCVPHVWTKMFSSQPAFPRSSCHYICGSSLVSTFIMHVL